MKNLLTNSASLYVLSALLVSMLILSCEPKEITSFQGEESAVALADKMFESIGGKEAWCELKSLYIKAEHTEPQMDIPYQSEIWRAMDRFEIIIEQQNDSFHVKGVITDDGGRIRYFDQRDTFRNLTEDQLENWKFDHRHNVYVLLHDLGCNPQNYRVEIGEDQRIYFYQDTLYRVSFGLDDQHKPYLFYRPKPDGSESGSVFTHWGTDKGLVHSAGGHPLDSNFIYRTEIWHPSQEDLHTTFGDTIFRIE